MHTSLAAGPLRSAMLGRGIRFPCCIAASAPLTTTTISPPTKHIEFPRSVANLSTKCSTFSKKPLTHSSVREKHPLIEKTSATSQPAQSIITSSLRRNFSNSANLQASPSTSPSEAPLDWNTFFKLRASRRRYSLISSVLASITSTAAGVQILSAQDLDALGAQVMGLDPFIVLGLATAAFGAMGWLIGPVLGNAVWGLVHRQYRRGVAIKEKEFFNRIKRFRVDPSANSIANPVPDYYGEKIGSVQGYRQWLKDQRAYNRKKSRPLL